MFPAHSSFSLPFFLCLLFPWFVAILNGGHLPFWPKNLAGNIQTLNPAPVRIKCFIIEIQSLSKKCPHESEINWMYPSLSK